MSSLALLGILACVGIGVLMIAFIGGITLVARRNWQTANHSWGEVARRTGLTFKPMSLFSSPELSGEYRQRPIHLYTYSSGPQRYRSTYTAIRLGVKNAANSMLDIAPAGLLGNFIVKTLNAQDVQIGNPAFDERFVVKSNPADFAARVLADPKLMTAIMDIPHAFRIQLEGTSLINSKQNATTDVEFLAGMCNTLSDLADRCEALQ
jgi:hypothetical protein